ncbi:hypothetical protein ACOMHN_007613 [Nucella lapillus]
MSSCSKGGRHQIYNAINWKTSLAEIERLLKEGKSPNASPKACPPPLHRAVRFNRPDIAMVLLKAGCQVRSGRWVEALHSPIISIAADLSMTEVVLHMASKPECDSFAMDGQLQSIVHIAVMRKNYDLLEGLRNLLCGNDFDRFLTLRDGLGLTPLHLAASTGDLKMLKLLFQGDNCCQPEHSQNPQSGGAEDLRSNDFHDDRSLDYKQESDREGKSCSGTRGSFGTAGKGKEGGRRVGVDHGVMGSKETMLHLAAHNHHLEVVTFLLTQGAKVNAVDIMNNTPLHMVIAHGRADCRAVAVVRCLLNAGADWQWKGTHRRRVGKSAGVWQTMNGLSSRSYSQVTPGMVAAIRNRVAYLRVLAEFGAQFDEVCTAHMTALMYALCHAQGEAAGYLVKYHSHSQALLTCRDHSGNTPLHFVSCCGAKAGMVAAIRNRVAYLRVLAEFGAQFDEVCTAHMTALMYALCHAQGEAAGYLVKYHSHSQALLTCRDHSGNTPLHFVSCCGAKAASLTELMLDKGYGVALQSPPSDCLPSSVAKPSGCWRQASFSPVTSAILHRRLDVLRCLVTHDPRCLSGDATLPPDHSPLHAAVRWVSHPECVPLVDFLLAHGCDGNGVVCGVTPYQYGVGDVGPATASTSAAYLRTRLGAFFLEGGGGGCPGRKGGCRLWSLRDRCLEYVRKMLRAAPRGSYYQDVCSLPLPQCVIRSLLFES